MKPAVLDSGRSRYVVQEFLTEGGMGAIYLGRRLSATASAPPSTVLQGGVAHEGGAGHEEGEEVILKALLPDLTAEPALVELFVREARLTASLDHPHIVRTRDFVAGQGTYFIVMEYVMGADLRTLERRARRRRHQLAPPVAIHVGCAILSALEYAHKRRTPDGKPLGLIHRDVSPSNILVSGAGIAKLSDFGIAKLSTHHSAFHKVKGKVGYMSPEQARGDKVDARSDLFSLAVCIHEGLVGERLYAGAAASPSVAAIYAQRPARPSERRPELPAELDAWMDKALAIEARDRFQSAAEMRDALLKLAKAHGLAWSDAELGAHLREACGDEPRAWMRGDLTRPPVARTEVYASGEESPRDQPEGSVRPLTHTVILEGTALTSVLESIEDAQDVEEASGADASLEPFTPPPADLTLHGAGRRPRQHHQDVGETSTSERGGFHEELTAVAFDEDETRVKVTTGGLSPQPVAHSDPPTRPMRALDVSGSEPLTAIRPTPLPAGPLDAAALFHRVDRRLARYHASGLALVLLVGGALALGLVLGLIVGAALGPGHAPAH